MALSKQTFDTLVDALTSLEVANKIVAALAARAQVAVSASDTETLAGMTTPVTISAVTAGSAGNSIVITADGTSTITLLVSAWNTAHPSNTAAVTAGTASQIPTSGAFTLHGGSDAAAPVVFSPAETSLIIDMLTSEKAGNEMIAALASGAQLSKNTSIRIIVGLAGDNAGAAGNDLINNIQTVPNAHKIYL